MDNELEMIRSEMDATKESLASKIENFETQIRDTVHSAGETVTHAVEGVKELASTVSDTVSSVKESVTDTVTSVKESVKDTFNVTKHVEDHPWASFGAAVAVGFAAGALLGGSGHSPAPSRAPTPAAPPAPPPPSSRGSLPSLTGEHGLLETVVDRVRALAIGSLMTAARDYIHESTPESWHEGLTGLLDDLSTGLLGDHKGSATTSFEKRFASSPDPAWTGPAANSQRDRQTA